MQPGQNQVAQNTVITNHVYQKAPEETCCCCIPLKTGQYILGVFAIISLIYAIVNKSLMGNVSKLLDNSMSSLDCSGDISNYN
jgi:hypothetical protein